MKILCLGGWGFGNLGDEFILRGTLEGIKLTLKEAKVTFTSFNPETTRKWHRVDVIPSLYRVAKSKNSKTVTTVNFGRAWVSLLLFNYAKHFNQHLAQEIYSDFDLIIQAGGGYFNGLFYTAFPYFALELQGAINSTTQAAIIGQTIGPFPHRFSARQASRLLKQIPLIYVRDGGSMKVLSDLGIYHGRRCADSALLVKPNDFRRSNSNNKSLVVFMQRSRPYMAETGLQSDQLNRVQLLDSLAKVLKEIAIIEDVDILITTSVASEIQWKMCQELASRLTNRHGYTTVRTLKPTCPADVCDALSNAKVCISMNMHPLILASILRIPCIGISYSWKLDQFMKESYQAHRTIPLNTGPLKFQALLYKAISEAIHQDEEESIHDAITQLKYCALKPFESLAAL